MQCAADIAQLGAMRELPQTKSLRNRLSDIFDNRPASIKTNPNSSEYLEDSESPEVARPLRKGCKPGVGHWRGGLTAKNSYVGILILIVIIVIMIMMIRPSVHDDHDDHDDHDARDDHDDHDDRDHDDRDHDDDDDRYGREGLASFFRVIPNDLQIS